MLRFTLLCFFLSRFFPYSSQKYGGPCVLIRRYPEACPFLKLEIVLFKRWYLHGGQLDSTATIGMVRQQPVGTDAGHPSWPSSSNSFVCIASYCASGGERVEDEKGSLRCVVIGR